MKRLSNHEVEQIANRTLLVKGPKNTDYLQGMDEEKAKFGALYSGQSMKVMKETAQRKIKLRTENSMMCMTDNNIIHQVG